jgi:tetratricopeptide (TPR) repeat protein
MILLALGGEFMNLKKRKSLAVIFISLVLVFSMGSLGCSKEAKKERHWNRGEKYFSENKFKEAIIEYKNVLQIEPKDSKARYKLGLSHLKTGQFREAFSELSKTVELDGNISDARLQLGNLYLVSRNAQKAREQAEKVLEKEP